MNKADLLHLPLGTEVVFNGIFKDGWEQRAVPNSCPERWVKTWKPRPRKLQVGVYIGYRFLQEGYVAYSEDSRSWTQLNTILCALIVTKPRKNPIRVPIDCVELLHD